MKNWRGVCLLGALALAGCGSTKVVTSTATTTATTTVSHTRVIHAKPKVARVVVTTTVTTTATAAPVAATTAPSGTYSGNGTTNVGTMSVPAQSTLTWQCRCTSIAIVSDLSGGNVIDVGSQATSGTSAVDPGTYTNVRVISDGPWAFVIQ